MKFELRSFITVICSLIEWQRNLTLVDQLAHHLVKQYTYLYKMSIICIFFNGHYRSIDM